MGHDQRLGRLERREGRNPPALCCLGMSVSAMGQKDTPEQTEILCELIDAIDGEIWNDWDGKIMTKDEAKEYVRDYRS